MANRRVLMVAFHFPPLRGSSGIERTLRFARYLPEFGWDPIVLTATAGAYEQVDASPRDGVPAVMSVHRALALDAARHLAVGGKYPAMLAQPDRWVSWWLAAVPAALALWRRARPHALWSTYPIATAHKIGCSLRRLTRLPLIADFRDPMAQDGYPADPATWRSFKRIEARTIACATYNVFTTPGAADLYRTRYPAHAERMAVIENGFDEESFAGLTKVADDARRTPLLLHSGIVYPSERDPTQLLAALRTLVDAGKLTQSDLRLRFRAPVHGAMIEGLAAKFGVGNFVEVAPPLPYVEALREMLGADGLLVLQADNCNQQIPAKLYEYLRAGRPIVGLADPRGDTAAALRGAGVRYVAALEDAPAIAGALEAFMHDLRSGAARGTTGDVVRRASRRERTRDLARLLDRAARP